MAAQLVKTKTPGVYKRGGRYAVQYRGADGKQRQESAPTYDAARLLKSKRDADAREGVDQAHGRLSFASYALDWIDRYPGRGRRGFREQTRRDYRRDLERYAIPFLDGQLRRSLVQITPRDVARFVGWLCDEQKQGERAARDRRAQLERAGRHTEAEAIVAAPVYLADATVRRILASVRSCLATAMHEGLIRFNPTAGAALPVRDDQRAAEAGEDDEPDRRALSRDELATLLTVAPERHRTLLRLLASTGLRISEALALRWQDVALDGSQPRVKVRRAYVKGRFNPPKSRHGRRDVPISHELVLELRRDRTRSEWPDDRHLVFCAADGRPLHDRNLSGRMLKPALQEAGAPWAGWHTLRHTCASMLFARGKNAVQVQRWLGHHSPGFTLQTYVHLLDEDFGSPLDLAVETGQGVSRVSARAPETAVNDAAGFEAEVAGLQPER
jgi:integrase